VYVQWVTSGITVRCYGSCVALQVADTDLAQLIAVDETSAHTRSSFESMFPSITGCHVLPCQSRSGDVGAGRSSPDALTVAVVHNGLLQRSGSLTAVLNSLVDEVPCCLGSFFRDCCFQT
jgi:hypothetical protein